MKGAAQLYIDTFASLGERLLTDIDILVQTIELNRAQAVMQKQGYEFFQATIQNSTNNISIYHQQLN